MRRGFGEGDDCGGDDLRDKWDLIGEGGVGRLGVWLTRSLTYKVIDLQDD
jgi:hypothetical protein